MHNSSSEQNIISQIAGKSSIQEIDAEGLQKIVNKYPYFGAAQYLLAKKFYLEKDIFFQQQIQKTALHFSNPLWLHYNLIKEDADLIKEHTLFSEDKAEKTIDISPVYEEVSIISGEEIILAEKEEKITDFSLADESGHIFPEDGNIIAEEEIPVSVDEDVNQTLFQEPENVIDLPFPDQYENNIGEPENISEEREDDNKEIEIIPTDKALYDAGENIEPENEITDESFIEPDNKISRVLKTQLADYAKPVDETTPLIIEPKQYYRVDYFASQGIKLNKDEEAENKLDAKVKRFTDWLKQMKRIGPQPADLGTDTASENRVLASAENSNQTGEVVTEAMAEVLAKQGKIEKAVEVYLKLSFLNPDKSAYFASQIQELKGL